MMWKMTICSHKSVFWDTDEWRCRTCRKSLTYPPRPPGLEDVKNRKRDVRIAAGEHRRRDSSPVEVEAEVEQLLGNYIFDFASIVN